MNIINQHKKKRQPTYMAFLDVTKAYDKAWLNAILYTAHKSGVKGKDLRIIKEINSNLTATIKTKHGNTRSISIKNSIRQGGVLSVIEYANLMDEISKEIIDSNTGHLKYQKYSIPGCLLWMDDVVLIHHDKDQLQKMLDITDDISKRYHIKFGKEKSQILTIGKNTNEHQFKLGETTIDHTNNYKYLGTTLNNKGNLGDHIQTVKGKAEAAIQTIFSLAENDEFHQIEMSVIWKLVHTCIIPILMYGAETWTPTKAEVKQIQIILDNILKRIIKTPTTTPTEIITAETGIWDIETLIAKQQIMYYHKICTEPNQNTNLTKVVKVPTNKWRKRVMDTLDLINLKEEEITQCSRYRAKKLLITKLKSHTIDKIYKAAEYKSKVRDYICFKRRQDIATIAPYMQSSTRTQCSSIFKARARMLKVKSNYKANYRDLKCRWCEKEIETQHHIIDRCPSFNTTGNQLNHNTIFEDSKRNVTETAKKLQNIINKLTTKE